MGEIFYNIFKSAKGAAQSWGNVASQTAFSRCLAFLVSNHGTAARRTATGGIQFPIMK